MEKLATIPGAEEVSPELRDFLDRVIVPALLGKYENFLALEATRVADCETTADRGASDGEKQ